MVDKFPYRRGHVFAEAPFLELALVLRFACVLLASSFSLRNNVLRGEELAIKSMIYLSFLCMFLQVQTFYLLFHSVSAAALSTSLSDIVNKSKLLIMKRC